MTFKYNVVADGDTVMIKRQIIVKSKADDLYKQAKKEELEKNLRSAKDGHAQLTEHLQKIQDNNGSANDRKRLEEHVQKLVGQIAVMQYQLHVLNELKPGDYFTDMIIESFTTLKKGDNIRAKIGHVEIITKDNIIQEMHDGMKDKQKT